MRKYVFLDFWDTKELCCDLYHTDKLAAGPYAVRDSYGSVYVKKGFHSFRLHRQGYYPESTGIMAILTWKWL